MKKLLLLILVPLLSTVFVTVEQFERLEQRVEYLESLIETQNDLLNETLSVTSEYYTIDYVIEDGYAKSMTVCALFDGECKTGEANTNEQQEPFTNDDRETILNELIEYGELLDAFYEMFG